MIYGVSSFPTRHDLPCNASPYVHQPILNRQVQPPHRPSLGPAVSPTSREAVSNYGLLTTTQLAKAPSIPRSRHGRLTTN